MKPPQPVLPGASKAIKSIFASPYVVTALCLAGALAAFLVYPAYAQSGDEALAPSNLTAAIADGGVILNWSSPVQDAATVTGYEILRRRPKEGEDTLLVLVADTGSAATTYVDATANEPGIRYVYRVKALRGSERSSRSNYARVDLPEEVDETEPTPAPAPRDDTVQSKDAQAETCPDPAPTPTAVAVTAVPIVVESTTDDYFVLYVIHDVDGTEVELRVLVKKGEAGTTTLAENVEALPKERYRVEKYLIADPADVDGDCFDDITELGNPVGMNPVNPAPAIALNDGAVVIPDRDTFEALAISSRLKFIAFDVDTDRPVLYFINTKTHDNHISFLDAVGLDFDLDAYRGDIAYDPTQIASDGSLGIYYYNSTLNKTYPFNVETRVYTILAVSLPLIGKNLSLYIPNKKLPTTRVVVPLLRESRIPLLFTEDVIPGGNFLALNTGEGYGRLQVLDPDDRPHSRDLVIYEALPNELPRVAGIISTVPQTPLSHVNLRAIQNGVPNAFVLDVLDKPGIDDLIGSYVRYVVTDSGWDLRAATFEEVETHYEASRPAHTQIPERDLNVTEIKRLSEISFDDSDACGVKATNVAELRKLGFPNGTVPDGFAVPFYFYDEFMKANDLYSKVSTMLADPTFQTDYDTKEAELKDLRDAIKDATTPDWIITALEEMHAEFPGKSLRYRSSTNNEDLPGFNGAGLYDSKSQKPDEDVEDGLDKSIKGVWASLWNFRAFTEREFHRIDHLEAAMGVLVHPSYQDELANGVAVTFNPLSSNYERYYVNTQLGEDLVTNPEAHSTPEELLLRKSGSLYVVLATSNLVDPGELLMSYTQLRQLRDHLTVIHDHFKALYNPAAGEPFAMEIEFKITSDNVLAIKQARPWVFSGAAPPSPDRAGTVALSSTQPRVDNRVIATLTNPDGSISNLIWQWAGSPNGGSNWATISGAASARYTPVEGDVGSYLRAVASYTDGHGPGKSAQAVSANTVQSSSQPPPPPPPTPSPPEEAREAGAVVEVPTVRLKSQGLRDSNIQRMAPNR